MRGSEDVLGGAFLDWSSALSVLKGEAGRKPQTLDLMIRFIHVCLLAEPFSVWRETLAARNSDCSYEYSQLNYSALWFITRPEVVWNPRFETTCLSPLQEGGQLDRWIWNGYVAPKRLFKATLRRVITQKTEEFTRTAANAYDFAKSVRLFCRYF